MNNSIDTTFLKYRIKERLNALSRGDYQTALDLLPGLLGVSKSHFYRMCNITTDTRASITSDQLITLADYFECTVDALLSKPATHA